jgi:hypothetical protein
MRLRQFLNELSMKRGTTIKDYKDGDTTTWVIETTNGDTFQLLIGPDWMDLKDGTKIQRYEILFVDDKGSLVTSKKSTRTALELFAAIERIVTTWIIRNKPPVIVFGASSNTQQKETSKKKLYVLLAKKIAKTGKYILLTKDNHIGKYQLKDLQYLVRKEVYERHKKPTV